MFVDEIFLYSKNYDPKNFKGSMIPIQCCKDSESKTYFFRGIIEIKEGDEVNGI